MIRPPARFRTARARRCTLAAETGIGRREAVAMPGSGGHAPAAAFPPQNATVCSQAGRFQGGRRPGTAARSWAFCSYQPVDRIRVLPPPMALLFAGGAGRRRALHVMTFFSMRLAACRIRKAGCEHCRAPGGVFGAGGFSGGLGLLGRRPAGASAECPSTRTRRRSILTPERRSSCRSVSHCAGAGARAVSMREFSRAGQRRRGVHALV